MTTKDAARCRFLLEKPPPPTDKKTWQKNRLIPEAVIHFLLKTVAAPLGAREALKQLLFETEGHDADRFRLAIPDVDAAAARACLLALHRQLSAFPDAHPASAQVVQQMCATAIGDSAIEAGFLASRLLWPAFCPISLIDPASPFWSLMVLATKAKKLRMLKLSAAVDFFIETKAPFQCVQPNDDIFVAPKPGPTFAVLGRITWRDPSRFTWMFDCTKQTGNPEIRVEMLMRQVFQGATGTSAGCSSASLLQQAADTAVEFTRFVHEHLPRELVSLVGLYFYDDEFQWAAKLPANKTRTDIPDLERILAIESSFLFTRDRN